MRTYMTCRDLQELRAYDQIEPFGEEGVGMRIAYATANLAAYFTGNSQRISDFMPNFETKRTEQQTVEEMQAPIMNAFKIADTEKGE